MRSILLAVVLAASSLVATTRPADACGGSYEWRPQVFAISIHNSQLDATGFVVFDERLDAERAKQLAWTRVAMRTYDHTTTAPAEKLATPVTFTLVGPSGTKIVRTLDKVWIDLASDRGAPRSGMRIPLDGDYRVALLGEFPDTTWESVHMTYGELSSTATARGLQLRTTWERVGKATTSVNRASYVGYPRGLVTIAGTRYVALDNELSIRVVAI